MARKRKTPNQIEYEKQIRRITRLIKEVEKEGGKLSEELVPPKPIRVSKKRIQLLKKITAKKIYSSSEFVDLDTGEIITPKSRTEWKKRKKPRTELVHTERPIGVQDIPTFSQIYINNYRSHLKEVDTFASSIILTWLNNMVDNYGYDDVAQMLKEAEDNGIILTYERLYRSELAMQYVSELMNYFEERGYMSEGEVTELTEAFDKDTDWSDVQ